MPTLPEILSDLIRFQSITPEDVGCQEYLIQRLQSIGFTCQRMNNPPVSNFFALRNQGAPFLVFAGHTDVVSPGNLELWSTPPFELSEYNGMLYGRGVADMKGSIACMLSTASRFVRDYPDFQGSLGFLITSGEEGEEYHKGTPFVMEQLKNQNSIPDYCIVGEPSSTNIVGDVIKTGRRGSLSGHLILKGIQGHVAYPHLAKNPIHMISPLLQELTTRIWDSGNDHFPPTIFQITRITSEGPGSNVIPGDLRMDFNFRYSTEQTSEQLKSAVHACCTQLGLEPEIHWRLSGEPFLTEGGKLLESCKRAIQLTNNLTPELSTSGGTSDGRFIAPYGVEVIELGLVNATIHQVDERIFADDLMQLENMYYRICEAVFGCLLPSGEKVARSDG